jgi:hypothetical protein
MSKDDKTKCTVIYQGWEADLEDKAAVTSLLTPMFEDIIQRRAPVKMRRQFLFPELEPTAIELAYLVGQLEKVEADKKAATEAYKEAIDLLKLQIKAKAKAINEGMAAAAPAQAGEKSMLGATLGEDPDPGHLRAVGERQPRAPEQS